MDGVAANRGHAQTGQPPLRGHADAYTALKVISGGRWGRFGVAQSIPTAQLEAIHKLGIIYAMLRLYVDSTETVSAQTGLPTALSIAA